MRAPLPIVLALLAAGCSWPGKGGSDPASKLKVVEIAVGHAVGTDKRVSAPGGYFAPADTIYTSVVTDGDVPRATLSARWLRQGAVLQETEQEIAPTGTAVSEFHVFNPSGWAPGDYRVEILIDGRVVGDLPFRVDAAAKSS